MNPLDKWKRHSGGWFYGIAASYSGELFYLPGRGNNYSGFSISYNGALLFHSNHIHVGGPRSYYWKIADELPAFVDLLNKSTTKVDKETLRTSVYRQWPRLL